MGEYTEYKSLLRHYERPSTLTGLWQLTTTVGLFFIAWRAAIYSLEVSYGLTLLLCVLGGGLLLRIFMLQHDCGHRSLLRSKRGNDLAGIALSLLTWTPYHRWRKEHAAHHATSGDLDRRGAGALYLLTVSEYQQSSAWIRLAYRIYRNPLFLLSLGPLLHFVVVQRFPLIPRSWRKERRSVHWTNGLMAASVVVMAYPVGLRRYLLVHLPIIALACSVGVFLFLIQHHYEGAFWRRKPGWEFVRAGLEGSSHFRLPRVLEWFSASVGYHHIHHLNCKVPNYRLRACHELHADFRDAPQLNLRSCWSCLSLQLWDEDRQRLVSFRELTRPTRRAEPAWEPRGDSRG